MRKGIYYPFQDMTVAETRDGQEIVRDKVEGSTITRNHKRGMKRFGELYQKQTPANIKAKRSTLQSKINKLERDIEEYRLINKGKDYDYTFENKCRAEIELLSKELYWVTTGGFKTSVIKGMFANRVSMY